MTTTANDISTDLIHIEKELAWLERILELRRDINAGEVDEVDLMGTTPPEINEESDSFAQLLSTHQFDFNERLLLILALAPHIQPSILDIFKSGTTIPTSFGGVLGANRAFLPTGETFMFILAGNDVSKRVALRSLFEDSALFEEGLIYLDEPVKGEPALSGILKPAKDILDLATIGKISKPDLSPGFPAKLIKTNMEWEDLVLPPYSMNQLTEIESWLKWSKELMQDKSLGRKIKSGYKALFYGPPGTGKTLAATLIGKKTGRDTYRIDLSTVVSKYIGETEKNLKKLFDRAEKKDWILFFDEADALFGKRTDVSDAHDRFANQEVSYLLQRLEYYDGLVILATNMKNNIDKAFMRRFQNIIHFPIPKASERYELWKNTVPDSVGFDDSVDLHQLSKEHEITGAHIVNVMSYCALKVLSNGRTAIDSALIRKAIARELAKEGKTL